MCRQFDSDETSPALRTDGPPINRFEIGICEECHREASTERVEFFALLGLVLTWHCHPVAGNLCRTCVHKAFWASQGITTLCGWWNPASVFLTPVILLSNICLYVHCCMTLKPVPRGSKPPQLSDEDVERLSPFSDDIGGWCSLGLEGCALARYVGRAAGVTPGQVLLFIWRQRGEWKAGRVTKGYRIELKEAKQSASLCRVS